MDKKIGIIGSGIVAKTLATGFLKKDYEVMLGTRDTSKLESWKAENAPTAQLGSFRNAADYGDILVLAVKGKHAKDALELAGIDKLAGKTIIDTTNPIDDELKPVNGVLNFFTGPNYSLLENLQSAFPAAHFVKAFNSVGSDHMVDPAFESKPTMFICGNHESSKSVVKTIVDQFGWETEDMGNIEAARAIEPLCMLWCIPGFRENNWSHAFKLLKK
jgi:predicted dinucleotide-binding enzyme